MTNEKDVLGLAMEHGICTSSAIGILAIINFAAAIEQRQAGEIERLSKEVAMLRDSLSGLVDGAIPEVNENGAGGFLLARLSDARTALSATQPTSDAFVAGVKAGVLEKFGREVMETIGQCGMDDYENGREQVAKDALLCAEELLNSVAQGKDGVK